MLMSTGVLAPVERQAGGDIIRPSASRTVVPPVLYLGVFEKNKAGTRPRSVLYMGITLGVPD